MATSITGLEDKVALFDTVSGITFGPVFDSSEDATEFLQWLQGKEGDVFQFGNEEILFLSDPRVYRPGELEEVIFLWRRELEGNLA